jgi:hypothetical protein
MVHGGNAYLDLFNRLHRIAHIIPSSGPTLCYGAGIWHGPKQSKKENMHFVESYSLMTTRTRKSSIVGNASDGSSSYKDETRSWTAIVTERARTGAKGAIFSLKALRTLPESSRSL